MWMTLPIKQSLILFEELLNWHKLGYNYIINALCTKKYLAD